MKTALVAALALASGAASAASFVNGGFEDGNASSWTVGGGSRASQNLSSMNPSDYASGGSRYNAGIASSHSSIVTAGSTDPFVGSTVYSGNYAWRVEDTTSGGYVSTIRQSVSNYTDSDIFFAWKAVLENGGHSAEQSAGMIIRLTDDTSGDTLVSRVYNAVGGGGGVDTRFSQSGNYFFTPQWQIEQLSIDATRLGHDFTLTVLATDCGPSAHEGYVFLDGFGAVNPPPTDPGTNVPLPGSLALMALGLGLIPAVRRRK